MSWRAAAATVAAAGCAGSAVLLAGLLSGRIHPHPALAGAVRARLGAVLTARTLLAVLGGIVVLVVTGWLALAGGTGLTIGLWPLLFGSAGQQQSRIERLEALAGWVESLRDTLERGRGLPEVIKATAETAPPVLHRPLQDLKARMRAREPLDLALLALADDLDDAVADQVIAALALNARVTGRRLPVVLGALAASTRRQVDVRRQVEAERAGPRRGVKIVVVVTVLLVIGFAVLSPGYMQPFSTVTGQLVLAIAVGCFAAGFMVLRALATFHAPARFLATPGVRAAAASAAGRGGAVQPSVAATVLGSVGVRR